MGFLPAITSTSMAVDPYNYHKAFVMQLDSNPRPVFHIDMRVADDGAGKFTQSDALMVNADTNRTQNDVFYSGVTTNKPAGTGDLAYDFLSDQLYIADQPNRRILVVRGDFDSPKIILKNVNLTAIEIDAYRRHVPSNSFLRFF